MTSLLSISGGVAVNLRIDDMLSLSVPLHPSNGRQPSNPIRAGAFADDPQTFLVGGHESLLLVADPDTVLKLLRYFMKCSALSSSCVSVLKSSYLSCGYDTSYISPKLVDLVVHSDPTKNFAELSALLQQTMEEVGEYARTYCRVTAPWFPLDVLYVVRYPQEYFKYCHGPWEVPSRRSRPSQYTRQNTTLVCHTFFW